MSFSIRIEPFVFVAIWKNGFSVAMSLVKFIVHALILEGLNGKESCYLHEASIIISVRSLRRLQRHLVAFHVKKLSKRLKQNDETTKTFCTSMKVLRLKRVAILVWVRVKVRIIKIFLEF